MDLLKVKLGSRCGNRYLEIGEREGWQILARKPSCLLEKLANAAGTWHPSTVILDPWYWGAKEELPIAHLEQIVDGFKAVASWSRYKGFVCAEAGMRYSEVYGYTDGAGTGAYYESRRPITISVTAPNEPCLLLWADWRGWHIRGTDGSPEVLREYPCHPERLIDLLCYCLYMGTGN